MKNKKVNFKKLLEEKKKTGRKKEKAKRTPV